MDWTRPSDPKRPPRDHRVALRRGFFGRCPNCGRGAMFRKFLKVADHCPACGEALHHQRADDAPAYFVILILGHLVVPAALAVEIAFEPPYWVHALLWGPITVAGALALLPAVKGALVAWQWANYMHGFDPEGADDDPRPVVLPVAAGRAR
jgi:uncharacterized protein (DUF983 family)